MPSPFFRVPGIVSPAGLPTLTAMDVAPALSPRPLVDKTVLVQPYAMYDLGTDAASLASMSSGHVATPTAAAGLIYDALSLTTANAANAGVDTGIPDQQIGTWWSVFQLTGTTADGGVIMGCQLDDGADALTGWQLTRNSLSGGGRLDLTARGMTNGGRGLDNTKGWPLAGVAAGSILFVAIASDALNIEAMCGGSPGSTILGQAFGTATVTANPAAGDTLTINGAAITFVAGTPAAGQVAIGASAALTAANLVAYINTNSAGLGVTAVPNTTGNTQVILSAVAQGAAGNAVTLAKSSAGITLSGAALAGAAGKTVAARNVTLGNAYTNAAFYRNSQRFYEVGFIPSRLSLPQMQTLYAETKARLAAQGVGVR